MMFRRHVPASLELCVATAAMLSTAVSVHRRFNNAPGTSKMFTRNDVAFANENPEAYWRAAAARIEFMRPFDVVCPPTDTLTDSVGQWFSGGLLNVCYNAVDRHAATQPQKIALHYDSPTTETMRSITYEELLHQVGAVANVLQNDFGVTKGDAVIVYMSNSPEAVFTMLACARLGAVHSVVFGGFSAKELSKRILDSKAAVIVTATCGIDGKKVIHYKPIVDDAIDALPDPFQVKHCGVFFRKEVPSVPMKQWRDADMHTLMGRRLSLPPPACVPVASEHPFYMLYTSGTTGAPKGIVRETAGTAVVLALQTEKFLGAGRDDVVFTASDIGWIVGTNFSVYGPLLHGCTSVLYEGKPVGTPDPGAFFRIIEQYRVCSLFTAPTALRAIKGADPDGDFAKRYDTSSLRGIYLGGERTDPNTVHWANNLLDVPVMDNWWQTETGSPITCAPFDADEGRIDFRPGSCGIACPGWQLDVQETVDVAHGDEGSGIDGELVIKLPLPPGALSAIWGRPTALRDIYLKRPGYFSTFDAGEISHDGFVSVMARTDDVINVAGHRLSTGQMEGVLCEHSAVAEAAVVGMACGLRGEKPLGLVVLKKGCQLGAPSELADHVRRAVGPIAVIEVVIVDGLPKTRSGKVLRRTIRSIAMGDAWLEVPGTIEDPNIVGALWERIHKKPMPTWTDTVLGVADIALPML